MESQNVQQMHELFARLATNAKADPDFAEQVRNALAESGLLAVFGVGETLDVVDLLDAGGEDVLRARLRQMSLSELKQIVSMRQYDPEKETARWRSLNKFIDLIVDRASKQLEAELAKQSSGAAWML
ncbi:MAG TPA: hypothetical protein VKQ30_04335 [Ktedonobacterales bacterium]|nr:hypothetical protein [Ktedonobacterales bacterium]